MKAIAVKGASEALRRRLEASAERNHRSLNQEALARLEMSFAVEDAARSRPHQAWVDEALGCKFKPGSAARLRQIAARAELIIRDAAACEETLDVRGIQRSLDEAAVGRGEPARKVMARIRARHKIPRSPR